MAPIQLSSLTTSHELKPQNSKTTNSYLQFMFFFLRQRLKLSVHPWPKITRPLAVNVLTLHLLRKSQKSWRQKVSLWMLANTWWPPSQLQDAENCQDYQALRPPSLGQSHSATFQTEPTAACEKSNLGAEGGANASVGTPGAKATWLPSCPFWKPVSLGSGAQRLWGTQGAYAKQPRGPSIPSIRPCLDYGKWRATGSGPDAETRPRNGEWKKYVSLKKWVRYKLDTSYTEKVSCGPFCILNYGLFMIK